MGFPKGSVRTGKQDGGSEQRLFSAVDLSRTGGAPAEDQPGRLGAALGWETRQKILIVGRAVGALFLSQQSTESGCSHQGVELAIEQSAGPIAPCATTRKNKETLKGGGGSGSGR